MTTPATRAAVSAVSFAATVCAMVALGGCARGPSPVTTEGAPVTSERRLTLQFENEARTYVDVYLVGAKREWWLGRVSAGALTTLRVPEAARDEGGSFMRLAVLAAAPLSVQAAREPRATLTVLQPAPTLLSQRWTFSQRAFAGPEIKGMRPSTVAP